MIPTSPDFHVGLRSDLEEEYLKFGVRAGTVFVSTPSPSFLKATANMQDKVNLITIIIITIIRRRKL